MILYYIICYYFISYCTYIYNLYIYIIYDAYIYIMFIALPMGSTQHPVLQLWWLLGVIKITWTQELSWDDPTWPYLGREQTMIQMRSSHLLGSPTPSPVNIISYHVEKKSHSQAVPQLDPPARVPTSSVNLRSPSVSVGSYSTPTSERASSRRSGSGWLGHQRMWLEATGTTEESEMQA
jgi:hypothetical protein